jgi:hypothetical protein
MRMLLVQHKDGDAWVDSVREDLIAHGGEHLTALFYRKAEADAYIIAMCGLIHFGGSVEDFRIVEVEDDGTETLTRQFRVLGYKGEALVFQHSFMATCADEASTMGERSCAGVLDVDTFKADEEGL